MNTIPTSICVADWIRSAVAAVDVKSRPVGLSVLPILVASRDYRYLVSRDSSKTDLAIGEALIEEKLSSTDGMY